jgi:glucose 1-dehydrogenase
VKGLAKRNVLVTGASSGIGQAIAVRFGQAGANVAINYPKDAGKARETEREVEQAVEHAVDRCHAQLRGLDVTTALVKADVSDEQHVARMVRETIDALGGLDVLINNAGIQVDAPTDEMRLEDFDRVVAVNLRGAFLCAREAIRHWLAEGRRGIIVNVSSVHEVIPKPRFAGYSVSKGGMGNLPDPHARARVRGARHPRERHRAGGHRHAHERGVVQRSGEARRGGAPHPDGAGGHRRGDAGVVAFLCSDEAAYITGQTLYVDGGLTLYPDFRTAWSSE